MARGKRQSRPDRRAAVRHIKRNSCGGWDVSTADGHECSHHETDAQAVVWTRMTLRQSGGGVIVVHGDQSRVEAV